MPNEDLNEGGKDSIIASGSSVEDGIYEYWFTRKYDTGDSKDVIIEDKIINLVYAWGTTPTLSYHGPSQRSLAQINFASNEGISTVVDIGKTMIRSHGGIMLIAWAVLAMFGVGVARFGRGWKHWLKAHRLIQVNLNI